MSEPQSQVGKYWRGRTLTTYHGPQIAQLLVHFAHSVIFEVGLVLSCEHPFPWRVSTIINGLTGLGVDWYGDMIAQLWKVDDIETGLKVCREDSSNCHCCLG